MIKLPEFSIKIREEIYSSERASKELEITEELISEHLMRQPSLVAFWGIIVELADEIYRKAKFEFELLEALLDDKIRRAAVTSGEKLTEAQVKSKIKQDPDYLEAFLHMSTWKKNVGIFKKVEKGFDQRKDSVVEVARNVRAQQKDPDLVVMEEKHKQDLQNK